MTYDYLARCHSCSASVRVQLPLHGAIAYAVAVWCKRCGKDALAIGGALEMGSKVRPAQTTKDPEP